jgi:dolichol-phosphate mannosyltransferase
MSVWVVVPTYNEAENIRELVSSILKVLPKAFVVVVDDNSPDGTAEIVGEMSKADNRIHLLRRPGKLGYASAIVTGLTYAFSQGAQVLGHMDADFSHDPEMLPKLLSALKEGFDVAIGSRYIAGGRVEGWSLYRKVLSRGANWLVRVLLGLPVRDCTSGFRLYRREAIERLPLNKLRVEGWSLYRKVLSRGANWLVRVLLGLPVRDCTSGFRLYRREALERLPLNKLRVEGYGFLYLSTALAVWSGLKIAEVPIVFVDRRKGKSKLSRRIIAEAAVALAKVFVWRKTGKWLGSPLID